jgi:hypothetical protein
MKRSLAIVAVLGFLSHFGLSAETNEVYFAGKATFVTEQQYWDLRKKDLGETADTFRPKPEEQKKEKHSRFYLLLNNKTGIGKVITVWVLKESETLTGWRLNTKISCRSFSIPESAFSNKARADRTSCQIKLIVTKTYPGGYPSEIAFSQLEWSPKKKDKKKE